MSRIKEVDKDKIARSFLKGRDTYDQHATIQQRVSSKLVEKLKGYADISFSTVLEVGCCTGSLTELLLRSFIVEKLYINDLVPEFQKDVIKRLAGIESVTLEPLFGDIEKLSLPNELDLVISSATFQWLADIDTFFSRVAASLKTSGYLAFSIFGPGTLFEFKEVTGIGLEYFAIGKILDMLESYFVIEEEESVKEQLFFSSPREILRHLQATGVGGVQEHRWTPGALRKFEENYTNRFGGASGVPVTYMSSYIVASKRG